MIYFSNHFDDGFMDEDSGDCPASPVLPTPPEEAEPR